MAVAVEGFELRLGLALMDGVIPEPDGLELRLGLALVVGAVVFSFAVRSEGALDTLGAALTVGTRTAEG